MVICPKKYNVPLPLIWHSYTYLGGSRSRKTPWPVALRTSLLPKLPIEPPLGDPHMTDRETLDSLPKTNLLLMSHVLDLSYLSFLTCKMEILSISQHNMNEVYV